MAKAISGASAYVKVGEKRIGYANGVSASQATALARVDVLGQIDTKDIEPLGRFVTLNISFIRVLETDETSEGLRGGAESLGFIPKEGTETTEEQRTQGLLSFMENGWDLEVIDTHGGAGSKDVVIYRIEGCRTAMQNWAVVRGSLLGVNISAEAIRMIEVNG